MTFEERPETAPIGPVTPRPPALGLGGPRPPALGLGGPRPPALGLGTPPALGLGGPRPPALGTGTPRPTARPAPAYKGLPLLLRIFIWAGFAIIVGIVIGTSAPTALRRLGAVAALQPGMLAWYAVRAFGFLAYLVLASSVLYGLLLSTKILDAIAHRPVSFALHKDLSIVGLILASLHAAILVADKSFDFTPRAILVPFASPYAPISVGIGQLTLYASAVILLSFYVRKHIGQRAWRMLHYVTFLSFAGATYHGISSGSDSGSPWAFWIYVVPVTAMVFLITYRLVVGLSNRVRRVRPMSGDRASGTGVDLEPAGPLDRPGNGGFLRRPT